MKHGKGTSYGSCGTKSNYTIFLKLYFTAPNQPNISFGTIYSVCGIIKRFTTIKKSCAGKSPGQKLKLTDVHAFCQRTYFVKGMLKDVHVFSRYMSNNRHVAAADILNWARQSFGKTISEASIR